MRKVKRIAKDLEAIEVNLEPDAKELVEKLSKASGHTPQTVMEVLIAQHLLQYGKLE
jgi:hypothetical protein